MFISELYMLGGEIPRMKTHKLAVYIPYSGKFLVSENFLLYGIRSYSGVASKININSGKLLHKWKTIQMSVLKSKILYFMILN